MSVIERLRFYDGEYLRSSDWIAEQQYHVAMRRRLNVKLHLHGIVEGLILDKDADSVPGATFHSISPGMAIDQLGREIVVTAPYVLREETDLSRQGLTSGRADVWLCYRETATTPPAAGYRVCNEVNQNTRWREEFEVVIVMQGTVFAPGEADPDKTRGGVRIGWITLSTSGGTLEITEAKNEKRTYVGIHAQKVTAPSGEPKSFSILGKNSSAESLQVVPAIFADKHVIVGEDFDVDTTALLPAADAATLQALTRGVAKIENALFVHGSLYALDNGTWYSLKELVKSQIPDIQVGTKTFTPTVSSTTDIATGSETISLTSRLANASSADMILGLSSMSSEGVDSLLQWIGTVNSTTSWKLQVEARRPPTRITDNQFEFVVDWAIGPKNNPASPDTPFLPIKSVTVNYVAIFYP